jgi:hypothetical protein
MRVEASDLNAAVKETQNTIDIMLKAYDRATSRNTDLHIKLLELRDQILNVSQQFGGSEVRSEVGEKNEYPTIWGYIWHASNEDSTYGPTQGQQQSLKHAGTLMKQIESSLKEIKTALVPLEQELEEIGAPKVRK